MKTWTAILLLTTFLLVSAVSRADQIRFSLGAGVTSAGTVSGGFVLAPTFAYGLRLSDELEVAMSSRVLVTGIVYQNPGFVVHNVPSIGFTWREGYINAGPSFDVLDTILCGANAFCNRVVGVAPGATLGGAYFFNALNGGLGLHLDAHVSVLPEGAVFSGPIWTITLGPELRLGTISR